MRSLNSRVNRLEDSMLPKPPHVPAVTLITSAIGGYAGLAEAKAQAGREGRPLIVINLVPAEFENDKPKNTPSAN